MTSRDSSHDTRASCRASTATLPELFSTSFECHVCGCPCEEVITKPCHGCGEEDPLLNTGLSIDEESLNWSLGKEWE